MQIIRVERRFADVLRNVLADYQQFSAAVEIRGQMRLVIGGQRVGRFVSAAPDYRLIVYQLRGWHRTIQRRGPHVRGIAKFRYRCDVIRLIIVATIIIYNENMAATDTQLSVSCRLKSAGRRECNAEINPIRALNPLHSRNRDRIRSIVGRTAGQNVAQQERLIRNGHTAIGRGNGRADVLAFGPAHFVCDRENQ